MNTDDLRDRLARELDVLQPPPDLVPGALRAGSRVVRRRRLAAGSLFGALGVGAAIAVPMALDARPQGVTPSPAGDPDPTPEPELAPPPPSPLLLGLFLDPDTRPTPEPAPDPTSDTPALPNLLLGQLFLTLPPTPGAPAPESAPPGTAEDAPFLLGLAPTPSGR